MRTAMQKWMLGTALVAGLMGAGALSANAQAREFRPGRGGYGYDRGHEREYVRPAYRPGFGVGFGVVGGPVVSGPVVEEGYIPPCPGEGYVWTAGYYNGGIWVPGRWAFRGGYGPAHYGPENYGGANYDRGRVYDRGNARGYARGDERGGDRHFDGRR